MALSKCGSCGKSSFQVVEKEPAGFNFKIMFVQCTLCGVPTGTMEYFNVGSISKKIEDRLEKLESTVSTINHNLRILARRLGM